MKLSKLALFSLALWVATVATFAWFFVRGSTAAGTDGRTAVVLQVAERDLVLTEMRGLLTATHGILQGVSANDMKQVAAAARTGGMNAAADVNPALMAKLPLPFKELGMGVHHRMDDIAAAAENGKPAPEIMGMLTDTMSSCIACHASWQLQSDGT
ncbi:MAG: hypothetical protein M0P59_09855 [Gallionella sp.]|jgi:hypothetical protein|nr:hypothetical protein [Gallionella sp.]MCK9354449.1 hypothetical protein [Gallionella sp.]